MDIWSCLGDIGNGMTFAVFNPISGKPWYSHQIGNTGGGQYGDDNTSSIDLPAFDFFTDYPPASALFRHRILGILMTRNCKKHQFFPHQAPYPTKRTSPQIFGL